MAWSADLFSLAGRIEAQPFCRGKLSEMPECLARPATTPPPRKKKKKKGIPAAISPPRPRPRIDLRQSLIDAVLVPRNADTVYKFVQSPTTAPGPGMARCITNMKITLNHLRNSNNSRALAL